MNLKTFQSLLKMKAMHFFDTQLRFGIGISAMRKPPRSCSMKLRSSYGVKRFGLVLLFRSVVLRICSLVTAGWRTDAINSKGQVQNKTKRKTTLTTQFHCPNGWMNMHRLDNRLSKLSTVLLKNGIQY